MKDLFQLTDEDFKNYTENLGLDPVKFDIPIKLTSDQIKRLKEICGDDFVRTDDYSRLSVAYGKTMYDILRL